MVLLHIALNKTKTYCGLSRRRYRAEYMDFKVTGDAPEPFMLPPVRWFIRKTKKPIPGGAICTNCRIDRRNDRKTARATKPKPRVKRKRREPAENLARAQKMVTEWETKLSRANSYVVRWRKRVNYYTKRVEEENVQLRRQLAEKNSKQKRRIVLEGDI